MKTTLSALLLLVSCFTAFGQGDGQLWGTTIKGGKSGGGTIFSTNGDANSYYKIRHEFTLDVEGKLPTGKLVKATNGKYYGVTLAGGPDDIGVIYEYDPNTSAINTLYEFTGAYYSGPIGSMIQASDGKLYGLTFKGGSEYSGTIYSFDIGTKTFTNEFTFIPGKTGVAPMGNLEEVAPLVFCGVTQASNSTNTGTIFEWDKNTGVQKILKVFAGTDGNTPVGGLIKANDGLLYGVTQFGGDNGVGVFYSFNRATDEFNVIHHFTSNESYSYNKPILSANGNIYGVTYNSVFQYSGGTFTTLDIINDGANNVGSNGVAGLYEASNGKIYTMFTKASDFGVNIVEYDRDSGIPTLKASTDISQGYLFGNDVAFTESTAGMLLVALRNGGATGNGGLVSYTIGAPSPVKIKDFGYGAGGSAPWGDLCRVDDKLYGMVSSGGNNGYGYIYEIDPVTEDFVIKYHFDGTNGSTPMGGLTLADDGKLYGMTTFGGPSTDKRYFSLYGVTEVASAKGHGVLFEFDLTTNAYTKLVEFSPTLGTNPWGRLIQASDGALYGMTSFDGANGGGTLFKYVINNGIIKKRDLPFTNSTVYTTFGPHGTLTEANGKLYGLTQRGGTYDDGTLFEYDLVSSVYTEKLSFSDKYDASASSTGSNPTGSLTLHPNGKLYGITSTGGPDRPSGLGGTIFEYEPGATVVTVKSVLESALWQTTRDLTLGNGGNMYSNTTSISGTNNVVFEFQPATGDVKIKYSTTGPQGALTAYGALTFVPGKSGQTIEFPQNTYYVMDQLTLELPKFSTANIEAVYESSDVTKATVSGNIVTFIGAGDVTFTGTAPGNASFEPALPAKYAIKILKGQQIITFEDFSATYGDGTITLPGTTNSGLPIEYTSTSIDNITLDGDKATILRGGIAIITAKQAGNDGWYPASNVFATLTINKANQTITFNEITEKGKVGVSFTPAATSSSGLPIVYESQNLSVAIIENNKVRPLALGTVDIIATQPGNANYDAAEGVTRTLTIEKGPQTVTVKEVQAKTVGDEFVPQATSTSGLTVFTYTTSSELSFDASRNVVKVVSPGMATLTAKQAGDDSWAEATSFTTFCANPAKPNITMSIQGTVISLKSSEAAGNAWKKDGVAVGGGTEQSLAVTDADLGGVYSVTSTVEGCSSQPSENFTLAITGDIAEDNTVEIFPNPATDRLYLRVPGNKGSKLSIISSEGRVMNNTIFNEESFEVGLHDYSSGVYVLRLNNLIMKFIKR